MKEYEGSPVGPLEGRYDGVAVLYKKQRLSIAQAEPSRAAPRRRASEWRAVRGGAHDAGAGVGDDDGAPVLHKKPWANGRTKYASLMGALCGIASERA